MKKFFLSVIFIAVFTVYVLYQRGFSNNFIVNKPSPTASDLPTQTPADNNSITTPTPVTKGKYKDGTYLGNVADAYYGDLQVKAIIKDGKITDVQFLKYPNDRDTSVEINGQAMPYLKQETIQAQSAEVQIISGATQTSIAFKESLAYALNQAQ